MPKPFPCPHCEKEYQTHSGLWKHSRKYHSEGLEDTSITENKPIEAPTEAPNEVALPEGEEAPTVPPEERTWDKYVSPTEVDDSQEEVTEKDTPKVLQFAAKTAAAPAKVFNRDININLLLMAYGATDSVLSTYARSVTNNEITSIIHSQEEKTFTANITADWLEDSGYDISSHVTPGLLALGVNAYYVGQPLAKIQRKSKVSLGAEVGSVASKIPILGGWLARRAAKRRDNGLGQNPPKFTMEDEKLES
jgi:hypothetical protein